MTRVASIVAVGTFLLPLLAGDGADLPLPGPQAAFAQGQGQGRGQGQDRAAARGGGREEEPPTSAGAARERQPRQAGAQRGQGGGNAAGRGQGNPEGQARQAERAGAQRADPAGRASDARGQARPERGQPASPRAGAGSARGAGAGAAAGNERGGGAPGRSGASERGARGRPDRAEVRRLVAALPGPARAMASSSRASERMAAGALALATGRGAEYDAFDLRRGNDRVSVLNPRGEVLLDLREDRARDLGEWELRRLGDQQPRENAPAFCRSGEGHPVWGREWCLDKGYGLGGRSDFLWSRGAIDDGYYRWPGDRDRYDRGGLIDVLGDVAMGRLALHALSLGLVDPLVGAFIDEPEGPRLLRIRSGDVDVAEFVDDDRDDRFTVLYVVAPRGY
jgi:hypothetical protein